MLNRVSLLLVFALLGLTAGCAADPESAKAALAQLKEKGRIDDISPTNFVYCAQMGDLQAVGLYLDSGMDVNSTNALQRTPLMGAAAAETQSPWFEHNIEIVQLLLKRGARVDMKDKDGVTALKMAKELHRDQVVALLEAAGAKE